MQFPAHFLRGCAELLTVFILSKARGFFKNNKHYKNLDKKYQFGTAFALNVVPAPPIEFLDAGCSTTTDLLVNKETVKWQTSPI